MANKAPAEFYDTFNPEVLESIRQAVERGYGAALDAHQLYDGFDSWTFGCCAYRAIVSELTDLCEELDGLEAESDGLHFRLQVGSYRIAVHKIGNSSDYQIDHSFPRNHGAPIPMPFGPYIPGLEPVLGVGLVLGHVGDPEEGLLGLHLCCPSSHDEYGRINEWGYDHEIYRREDTTVEPPSESTDSAPEEEIPEPEVRRRKRGRRPNA